MLLVVSKRTCAKTLEMKTRGIAHKSSSFASSLTIAEVYVETHLPEAAVCLAFPQLQLQGSSK